MLTFSNFAAAAATLLSLKIELQAAERQEEGVQLLHGGAGTRIRNLGFAIHNKDFFGSLIQCETLTGQFANN